MANPLVKFTYRDYLLLPEQDRRELIEGDFYVVPSPTVRHQRIIARLARITSDFVDVNRLGEILWSPLDIVLSDEDVVQADILFISNERRGIVKESNIAGAPDLVIEVLSPSTADRDKELKLRLYPRTAVREYWLVDPDQESVRVLTLGPGGIESSQTYASGAVESFVLPGLTIEHGRIFAED